MNAQTSNLNEIVISWLKTHGYYKVVPEPKGLGLIADGRIRKMVVIVRTADCVNENIDSIVKIAHKQNREPWLAIVKPFENEISWKALA